MLRSSMEIERSTERPQFSDRRLAEMDREDFLAGTGAYAPQPEEPSDE